MAIRNDVPVVSQDSTALIQKPASVMTATPLADIYETPDAFVVILDMPGATKESMTITVNETSLDIRSEVQLYPKEKARVLRTEIPGVGFHRAFNLTDGIDRNNIDARYENGVLTVKLFKKESMKPREIRIQ